MGLFKKSKRKTKEVEVQGEKFLMVEPSALNRILWHEYHEDLIKPLNDDSTNTQKGIMVAKSNAYLVAICLTGHFPDLSINAIRIMISEDITDQADLDKFTDAAEEVAGLKIEAKELPQESLETD